MADSLFFQAVQQLNQHPSIDINPIFIQYIPSIIIILLINFVFLYFFAIQMWKIYNQNQPDSIIHDIYDKIILHTNIKYVCLSIICIIYLHDLTSPPVQIIKVFWLYCLAIIFMKFDIKDILWPAAGFFCGLVVIAWSWTQIFGQIPIFKLILIQISMIVYFGVNQVVQITKILKFFKKNKKKYSEISVQAMLKRNLPEGNTQQLYSLSRNQSLDNHVIGHMQNRRSFCIVFCSVLIVNLILFLDLQTAKELLGDVILNFILDLLPLFTIFWYLKKTFKEKQKTNQRLNKSASFYTDQINSKGSRKSKIVIEMINLKS